MAKLFSPELRSRLKGHAVARKILDKLQLDATTPVTTLAGSSDLSVSACWRRVKHRGGRRSDRRVALVDRSKTNVAMTVFIGVRRRATRWLA
ncbi:AsnC family transcriptional regulator [Bradyrhizobium sp. USDA 4501]